MTDLSDAIALTSSKAKRDQVSQSLQAGAGSTFLTDSQQTHAKLGQASCAPLNNPRVHLTVVSGRPGSGVIK